MLSLSRLRHVTVKKALPAVQGNAFEAKGETISANVQPMNGDAAARQYGLQPSDMRQLLCASGTALERGDGVCVDVAEDAEPDYRVVYVADWRAHRVAHLRFIPADERGADE